MSRQISLLDNPTYAEFIEKFKPKKTTDDCYTPANVYAAVLSWVIDRYGIDPEKIDRPFWPGGDYENFEYTRGGCVVDNPPFSILADIINFYEDENIKYFLFAPYLTNFSSGPKCCHVISPQSVTYANGAKIDTSFITNLDDRLIIGDTDLFNRIKKAERENTRGRQMPKYKYPANVLMASDVGWLVKHGVDFEVKKEQAVFVRSLDHQLRHNKSMFGAGFLISDELTEKRLKAEDQARENIKNAPIDEGDAQEWALSEREREIIKWLSKLP